MSTVLYTGCSFSAGTGFALEKNDSCLWINKLHQQFFPNYNKVNFSSGGRSNAGIFQDTLHCLGQQSIAYAFVQWTGTPRINVELGFELFDTYQAFTPMSSCQDRNMNDNCYSASYLNSVKDRFLSLIHDCYEICNLIDYVNVILNVARLTKTQIFFANGIAPWDNQFFEKLPHVLPSQLTPYTQKILNVNNRNDHEIFELYKKMHQRFDNLGGIRAESWLNLYQSMKNMKIDVNDDNLHPGPGSNQLYADKFAQSLNCLL